MLKQLQYSFLLLLAVAASADSIELRKSIRATEKPDVGLLQHRSTTMSAQLISSEFQNRTMKRVQPGIFIIRVPQFRINSPTLGTINPGSEQSFWRELLRIFFKPNDGPCAKNYTAACELEMANPAYRPKEERK